MGTTLAGVSILVVEDDADNRELIESVLAAEGAVVRGAGAVVDAKRLLAESLPDVVLTDMGLLDGDGFDVFAAVRARAGGDATPVLALTGRADRASRERAVAAGFTTFVTKPFGVVALLTAVTRASHAGTRHDAPAG